MVFKNEKQLKEFLMAKCKNAVIQAENKVYAIIKRFLVEFYQDYDPSVYERTNQLLHSLVKSGIRQTRNGYEAEVYFDLGGLSYAGGNPSGEQVMEAASQGYHGAIGDMPYKPEKQFLYMHGRTGVSVWNDPIKELDAEAIEILADMLKAEGIPVKRG